MSVETQRLAAGQYQGIAPAFRDVLAFHKKFGCVFGTTPRLPDSVTVGLRHALIREESDELLSALRRLDVPAIADGGVDLIYVVLGMFAAFGIDPAPLWVAVQTANMSKEGGVTRADGKILKPPGFKHPDIAAILAEQKPIEIEV